MFLNNVKRFVALAFLVLLIVCSKNVSAQQNWRTVSLSEQQPKSFEEIENPNFEDLANSSFKFCLRADPLTRRQDCRQTKSQKSLAAFDESSKRDVLTSEIDFKIKTNFSVAVRTKPNVDSDSRHQALLDEDYAKDQNLISPRDISTRKSFQHFRLDIYPKHNPNLTSLSFDQLEESEPEKDKSIDYSRLQSANSFDKNAPDDQTAAQPEKGFRWWSAIQQSLMFLAVQHGYAFTQAKTRRELKGNFFGDYIKSVKSLRGWEDGGRFFTNYIAHPMQGSFTGFIQIQNDPKGLKQRFGKSADYWRSRAKALAWSAAWSTQFEIGPLSQASIGNVGLKGKQTYVDLVMTPLGGTMMIIGEDAIDRFVMRSIERRTNNFYVVIFSRMLLSPTRTVANLFRFKTPWYRDRPRAR